MLDIFSKGPLKKELEKLLERISRVAWDVAIRMAQARDQLSLTRGEISGLKSLLASRDAHWEIATWSTEFQDELRWAKKRISILERFSKGRSVAIDRVVRGLPLAIAPISVRLPPVGSYPSSGGRPFMGVSKDESRQPVTTLC